MIMKVLLKKLSLAVIPVLFIPLTACAGSYNKSKPQESVKYTITFLKGGEAVIRDARGNILEGKRLNLPEKPLPVKAIVNYNTIIEAEGSCLILIGGYYYDYCAGL